MTALIMERMRSFERWTFKRFPIAFGTAKAWKHGMCGINIATGKVEPAAAASELFIIGVFNETLDMEDELVDSTIDVNLCKEIEVEWWENDTSIAADDVGKLCFAADDQTVTLTANACLAGRIWAVDAVRGVAVEKLPFGVPEITTGP